MFSPPTISVGSNIFYSFALVIISVLVILLLRRFLTLRNTPAYLSVSVFLSLALPAGVVLLVPIDLASSSRDDGDGPRAIWLPERLILVSWRIAYWLIFVLTWYVPPPPFFDFTFFLFFFYIHPREGETIAQLESHDLTTPT